ncbi:hypothetical protein ACFX1X_027071 [Malus domestica]
MWGAVFVAIAAATGNLLQGWDNATIAGAVLYIKREFKLETQPTIEGLIVAMSLIGATVITTFSGPVSDWLGRRPMLIISSVLYFLSGLLMLWAPNVYVLLLARLLDGFGIGLAVTLVPVYISETAPPKNQRATEYSPTVYRFGRDEFVILHGVWNVTEGCSQLENDAWSSFYSFLGLFRVDSVLLAGVSTVAC